MDGDGVIRVDVLDENLRFITGADCELRAGGETGAADEGWGGVLSAVEPNAHLTSGRYRLRSRGGVEATVVIRARQRVGSTERYPFAGEGRRPAFEPDWRADDVPG